MNKHIKLRLWVKILIFLIVLIGGTIYYSRNIGIKGIKVKEYSVVNSSIPESFYGVKIVQISDIHYKVTTNKNDLKKIVKEINLLKPDIVVFTGDLFDHNVKYTKKDYKDLTEILKSIDYSIAKYAIKGEEDLKNEAWEQIINDSDFINLNDTSELIYYEGTLPILLVGISSNYKDNHIADVINNINVEEEYKYSILLLHEPDFVDSIDYSKFNLILAGHSHGGQIVLPFIGGIINDKYAKNYSNDYYDLGDSDLYISSGIGTSKYKFRLLNKPSINLYRLRNK